MSAPTDDQLCALGASLREIDPTTLLPDDEGSKVHWFLGDNGTELFVWVRGGASAHHVQLVFARVSAEWDQKAGLVTGTFQAGSSTAGGRYDPYLLTVGQNVDAEVCRAALRLLRSAKIDLGVAGPMITALELALEPAKAASGPT